MRGTSRPMIASAVNASCPKMFGTQNEANPSASAWRASATMSSIVPSLMLPPNDPMRMHQTVASTPAAARRGGSGSQTSTAGCYEHTMSNWNFADIWEVVADELPDAPCLIHGGERRTWREVDQRADGVARHLIDAGLERQQAVAQYMYNGPEYVESMYASFKGGVRPGQHELSLHRRRTALPVGQRRRRRRRLPRRIRRHHRRRSVTGCRRSSRGCGSTMAAGRARSGPPTTARSPPRRPNGSFPNGVAAVTTSTSSTPAARPACRRE